MIENVFAVKEPMSGRFLNRIRAKNERLGLGKLPKIYKSKMAAIRSAKMYMVQSGQHGELLLMEYESKLTSTEKINLYDYEL